MLSHDADPAEIACVSRPRRGYQSCEGDRLIFTKCQPPMAPVEGRNGRALKESQPVEVGQRIDDLIVLSVDLTYPISWRMPQAALRTPARSNHRPSMALMPSHIAPTRPATMTVAILFLDPKGRQDRGDRPQHDRIDVVAGPQ
jgi:hypothetical protein